MPLSAPVGGAAHTGPDATSGVARALPRPAGPIRRVGRVSRTPDAWTAVRGRPARFLASVWPWRSLAYVASTVPIGLAWLIVLVVVLGVGLATVVVVAGLFVLAGIPVLAHLAARGERRRLRLIFPGPPGREVPDRQRWPEI